MYAGKYMKNPAPKRNHKSIVLLVSVFVLIFAMVGGTLAYLATNTKPVENTFQFGSSDVTIPEEIDGGVKKSVPIKNNGNIPVYIRAQIIVTWKNAAGEIIPADSNAFTCTMNGDWFQQDGMWYYKNIVNPGSTAVLFTNGTKNGTPPAEGYDLSVEILAQTCQADGMKDGKHMVETIWTNVHVANGQLAAK